MPSCSARSRCPRRARTWHRYKARAKPRVWRSDCSRQRPNDVPAAQPWLSDSRTYLMKAIVQERYGGPDVLQLKEVDKPVAGPHDLLVRVHAAGINARDWHIMRGDPYIVRLISPSLFGWSGPKMRIRGS